MNRSHRAIDLRTSCLRTFSGLVFLFGLDMLTGSEARGDYQLVMTVENASVLAGGSGSFDIVLQDAATAATSASIAGFSIDLVVPAGSGVTLTAADALTSAPYIFDGNSLGFLATVTTGEVQANDFTNIGATTLTPGGPALGLAHISFTVAPGTPGGAIPLNLIDYQGGTSLSDDLGNNLSFTINDGQILIGSSSAVPEPSSVWLVGTALTIGLASQARKFRNLQP